jgi:GNAT superfamily N-acetyltransferase
MPDYRVRTATLADVDALVSHRLAMFTEMGTTFDAPLIGNLFRAWLREMMPAGEYLAWLCETDAGEIAAGAAITLLRWPPGPSPLRTERIAFVYNVYTEPPHRHRGLARRLMETVHTWCADHGVGAVALNAAPAAQHLYRTLGYVDAPTPMMWKLLQVSVIGS